MDSLKSKIIQLLIPGLSDQPVLVEVLDSIVPHVSITTIIKLLPVIRPFVGEENSSAAQPLLDLLVKTSGTAKVDSGDIKAEEAEASEEHKSQFTKLHDYLFNKEAKQHEKPLEEHKPEEIVENLKNSENGNSEKFDSFVSQHQDDISMLFKSLINHSETMKRDKEANRETNLSSFGAQHGEDILVLYDSFIHFGDNKGSNEEKK